MNSTQAKILYDQLGVIAEAHGELAAMVRSLNATDELLAQDRDAEAEESARGCWTRCEAMREQFMAFPTDTDAMPALLEGIERISDLARTWLGIIASKPPGWSEWRRTGIMPSHV